MVECLQKIWTSKQLKALAYQQFQKAFYNWQQQCPEEVLETGDDCLSEDDLILTALNISESTQSDHRYTIEATYHKQYANRSKVVYIIKFWDDFTMYDDVLYTEK